MKLNSKLLFLNSVDNCCCVKRRIDSGEELQFDDIKVIVKEPIHLGFKIACKNVEKGEKIIKWGMSIGKATSAIKTGEVIHTHNMTSDHIPTYERADQNQFFSKKK